MRMRWAPCVLQMGDEKCVQNFRETSMEETLGRPRRRWEYNIKMDLTEIVYRGVGLIRVVQDRDQWWAK